MVSDPVEACSLFAEIGATSGTYAPSHNITSKHLFWYPYLSDLLVGTNLRERVASPCRLSYGFDPMLRSNIFRNFHPQWRYILSGRAPQNVFRQLDDIKQGRRNGHEADRMLPVVANLAREDMIAIAAYLSSREQ